MATRAGLASRLIPLALAGACLANSAHAQTRRVDLQVLVVSSADTGTQMVRAGLDEALVPHTDVELAEAGRPRIDEAFLVDTSVPGVRRARYQAVVLANARPSELGADELEALIRYEREFHVRQLDAYVAPTSSVGLSAPLQSGTLDGASASVTQAGAGDAFAYLRGPVPFEDLVPLVFETYGYLAEPLAPTADREFTPFIEATLPGGGARGTILGVLDDDGREEMVLMVAMNPTQLAQQMLFPGMLTWLTRGVHLGGERAFLSVHVDDVFQDNGRWSETQHCTLTDDCEPDAPVQRIIMTPADVDYLIQWQARQGLQLHLAYNGGVYVYNGDDDRPDPRIAALGPYLIRNRARMSWINHTYTHEYLGCLEDDDHQCLRSSSGQVRWTSYQAAYEQIAQNIAFAREVGLAIDPSELVTGQHSGLRRPGREPSDNPNLLRALSDLSIAWVGADDSLEHTQRTLVANALTVPRYPMNIYYNSGTKRENTQEYNWLYTSRADGGSGSCEASGSCQPPLDPVTGFDTAIVPREARTMLMHMLGNDPRPHYAHQSNLAEERILYPVIDSALGEYRRVFGSSRPVVNPSMKEAGIELRNRGSWSRGKQRVEAYVQGGQVVLRLRDGAAGVQAPLTLTTTTSWRSVEAGGVTVPLPADVGYAR